MGHLTTIDLIFTAFLALVAFGGWRRGLVVTVLSLLGSLFGALVGHFALTYVSAAQSHTPAVRWATEGFVFLVAVSIGNGIGGYAGKRINKVFSWKPFRLIDHISGLTLALAGWALVLWIGATTLIAAPIPAIPSSLGHCVVVKKIDYYLPEQVRTVIDNWRHMNSLSLNLQGNLE